MRRSVSRQDAPAHRSADRHQSAWPPPSSFGSSQRGTFGGPTHGAGVTAIHLAAQAGQREAVLTLLELGADPLITDTLHGGDALGWARVGGHRELAEILP